ncbi:MAG: phytoene desaturase family protein [Cyclobacteriaceae bacterium]|nr:phytoene desaturase family protein [Cyclobacteriaceae bacterium]
MRNVSIIGSGVAGLATACRLAARGFAVTVFEANAYPGGKLTELSVEGYRFDAGPSLFTMPHFLDEVFTACGKNPRDYYDYRKIDTSCHYFFEDGTRLQAHADPQTLAWEIETKLGVPGQRVLDYLRDSQNVYERVGHIFLENSLHKTRTWLSAAVARALPGIPSYGLFTTLNQANKKKLGEARLVQLFNRYATYNGSDPYQAPGILTSIPHLEFNVGTFLPKGGMHTITRALHRLAVDMGVVFRFDTPVQEITVHGKRARGVRTETGVEQADCVVSNMDVYPTYKKLLPSLRAPERTLNQERSSSALIFYWGIQRSSPELDLHNILFTANYEHEFHCLFRTHTLTDDPTVYINITSKYEMDDAPPGCENWFVMINVPANKGQPWDELIARSRQNIIAKINRLLGISLEPLIAVERILDPRSIESRTGSYQGSLYGTSSNNRFAAFLRHPNFVGHVPNLFFCGGSAHPGGGIPLCLQSGRITSELVAEQFA